MSRKVHYAPEDPLFSMCGRSGRDNHALTLTRSPGRVTCEQCRKAGRL
jgi:hypothetical protein